MVKKKILSVCLGVIVALCAMPFFTGCVAGEIVYVLSEDEDHYFVYASKANLSEEAFAGICPYYSEETGPVAEYVEGTLPVTSIAAMGFSGCTKLKEIVVPDFITNIGYSAFAYCTGLCSLTLPSSLKIIPYGMIGGCNSLKYLEIPDGVERIETNAFYASHIKSITIPESVTYMGEGVFYRADYLESATIYANIDTVPYGTFCSCPNLRELTLPATVKEIKGYELVNGNGEVISEDDVIHYQYGAENDTEDPNYEDNVTETVPAFYYSSLEAGSNTITFDYELETLYFLGTEKELNEIVVGEYNICLTDSTVLTVYCWEDDDWKEVKWNFGR
ncbi:MAG: leucine-rich repeat domain-containing protein [Bacteroidales bacterium]|nr:leucine-rich repeat domain-containing protein [Bacteroidales bacterium]